MKNYKRRHCFVVASLLLAMTLFYNVSYAQHEGHNMPTASKEAAPDNPKSGKPVYYCPMHPTYTSDKPGDCPICNMKLVKKESVAKEADVPAEGAIYINTQKQQLIGVKTGKVVKMQMDKELRTVGRIAFDPELYKTQREYIEAINALEKVQQSGQKEIVERCRALVGAARLKLKLSGLSDGQIEQLAKKKENDSSLLMSQEGSGIMWAYATIYEYELDYVKPGQDATIKTVSYPDKEFRGKVVAIDPVFNELTRSVRARIEVENTGGLLKPNMYVDITMATALGEFLAVPKEAVTDSGLRKIVFIALPEGYFKPQEIKTGASTDDYVAVTSGLKEGDEVVTSGNFLIDSESKLKSALEGTSGHQHGQ